MRARGTDRSGALFSDCGRYRYRLWRVWDRSAPRVLFVLLNPSTADEINNDPTIERCQRRVVLWNSRLPKYKKFGAVELINGSAYRSTKPSELFVLEKKSNGDVDAVIGPDNGDSIHRAVHATIASRGLIICGWGRHLAELSSGRYTLHDVLLESLQQFDYPLGAFKLNEDGTPKHPLYIGYDVYPRRWDGESLHEELL